MHVLNCSVNDKLCAIGIFKKVVHSKIDALVKTWKGHNSGNLRSDYKEKIAFLLFGYKDHIYVLTILNNCYDHH